MHIPWEDVQLVLAVVEAGSLSGAAKRLRLTQPTVSRRIAALESSLGEPLFVRTVEGAAPTSFGERFLSPRDAWRSGERRSTARSRARRRIRAGSCD
jgi:DNA-binding transcriptional LysR family regulator